MPWSSTKTEPEKSWGPARKCTWEVNDPVVTTLGTTLLRVQLKGILDGASPGD
jgi:hypothetical protein